MRRKKTLRTVELTVERSEFFAAARARGPTLSPCSQCGGNSRFVNPAEAARASGESLREIFRRVEAAEIHFLERPDTELLICLDSLGRTAP